MLADYKMDVLYRDVHLADILAAIVSGHTAGHGIARLSHILQVLPQDAA